MAATTARPATAVIATATPVLPPFWPILLYKVEDGTLLSIEGERKNAQNGGIPINEGEEDMVMEI